MATTCCTRALVTASFVVLATFGLASAGRVRQGLLRASGDISVDASNSISLATSASKQGETCARLTNRGAFFSVDVQVGTPLMAGDAQTFSLVADTGSNHIIVPSCLCQMRGFCETGDRCFIGTNRSSTFSTLASSTEDEPTAVTLSFGSGNIQAVVASDVVTVGNLSTKINNSLMLMYGKQLNFGGSFEGILGLGIPNKPKTVAQEEQQTGGPGQSYRDYRDQIKQIIDQLTHGVKHVFRSQVEVDVPTDLLVKIGDVPQVDPKSFLEFAGVSRFGICFNEKEDGVFRMGTPELKNPIASTGVRHWGMDFRGVRIGDNTISAICSPEDMQENQTTPCGIIPDSGTTNILGPSDQVAEVLDAICDGWSRCSDNFTALTAAAEAAAKAAADVYGFDPFAINKTMTATKRSDVLVMLLADCDSWLTEDQGLLELPKLHFDVRSANSTHTQALELTGWSYVVEYSVDASLNASSNGTDLALLATSGAKKYCQHSFGTMSYNTMNNGPVWIMGMPLFHTYRVDYDIGTKPPSMSFEKLTADAPCGACDPKASLLVSEQDRVWGSSPRKVWGHPRVPAMDTTLPL